LLLFLGDWFKSIRPKTKANLAHTRFPDLTYFNSKLVWFGLFCFVFVLVVINWSNYFGMGLMTLNRSLLQSEPQHHSLMKTI